MKIKFTEVKITRFRNLLDLRFNLGNRITVFSGHNGVGKSSLISLMASTTGTNEKRLDEKKFQPEFNDYFTMDSDEPFKEYKIVCEYETDDNFKFAKRIGFRNDEEFNRGIRPLPRTSPRIDSNQMKKDATEILRNKLGITDSARVPIPTVYLSLARLYPPGETEIKSINMRSNNYIIQNGLHEKYIEWYNEVLPYSITDNKRVQNMTKGINNRSRIFVPLTHASSETQSVGQDNLGTIINALVDFYYLAHSSPDSYKGGILCIDEIDASLHPSAQVSLLNLLDKLSVELDLQIFLTTHSLTMLKEIILKKEKNPVDYQLIYLKGVSVPSIIKFNSYRLLKADLFQELTFKKPEIKVYCEDESTSTVFKALIDAAKNLELDFKLPPYKILPIFLGSEQLEKLPRSDTHFSNVAIILDGDTNSKEKVKIEEYMKNPTIIHGLTPRKFEKNFVTLPGFLSPEGFLYSIIFDLVKNDRDNYLFWRTLDKDPETTLYTSDKIREQIIINDSELCLKALKANKDNIFEFTEKSKMLNYYYVNNKQDLENWIKKVQKVFDFVSNKVMASRI